LKKLEFASPCLTERQLRKNLEVVRNLVNGFAFISEMLCLFCEGKCDLQTTALCFSKCEATNVVQTSIAKMTPGWNVLA